MYFTQEDYRKIERYLKAKAIADTQLNVADLPLNGDETIAIVQNNHNVQMSVNSIVSQFFGLGVADFINVTDRYNASYINIGEAISLIPIRARKIGQVITFLNEAGNWSIYQFTGRVKNQWNNLTLWKDLFESIIIDSILPDEEDLTGVREGSNEYLKFKNKEYDTSEFSGLGRFFVRKNIVEGKNILTQDVFSKADTIYIIQYDHDLNGQTITLPTRSVLFFEGGSISNGTLVGNSTSIDAGTIKIFSNIVFTGTFNVDNVHPEWFGAVADGITDNTTAINTATTLGASNIILSQGTYAISGTINVQNCNLHIERNATILATSSMEYMIVGDYPDVNIYSIKRLPIITGGGTIDGNGLADILCSFDRGVKVTIRDIQFKNAKVACIKASKSGVSGNLAVTNCTFINQIKSTTAVGIIANKSDSYYSDCSFLDYGTAITVLSGNNQFIRMHPWLADSSLWENSVVFDMQYPELNADSCEADTIRRFCKIGVDYAFLNVYNPSLYKNSSVVSDALATQYPPILIEKGSSNYSRVYVSGGKTYFQVPYLITDKEDPYDSIFIPRFASANTPDPNTVGLTKLIQLSGKLADFQNVDSFKDGILAVDTSNTSFPNLSFKWGGKFVDAEGRTPYSKVGNLANRPTLTPQQAGATYFNTTTRKLNVWVGDNWFDSVGWLADNLTKGTTSQRPTGPQVGAWYFDTDLNDYIYFSSDGWKTTDRTLLGNNHVSDWANLPTKDIYPGYTQFLSSPRKTIFYFGGSIGWVDSQGNPANTPTSGKTAARPDISTIQVGTSFFDTDLDQKIVSDGTQWLNPDGTLVSKVVII